MNRASRRLALAALLLLLSSGMAAAQTATLTPFYASQVINYTMGTGPTRGFTNTSQALGAPSGDGDGQGSANVLSLGNGGSLTVGFNDANGATQRHITNGSGADFIVSENAFYANGDTTASYAELMFVQVSTDGTHFAQFPTLSLTPSPVGQFDTIDPANVSGFAGVHPVYANPSSTDPSVSSINPFDPSVAGGDAFDLSDLKNNPLVLAGTVDLNDIRYIRLVDIIGDGTTLDSSGNPIYDPTDIDGSTNYVNGADVDAISVINGVVVSPEPGTATIFAAALCSAMLRRRRWQRVG